MIRYYGRPDRVARAMLEALKEGRIKTPGMWQSFLDHMDALPPRLRSWTLNRTREIVGDTAADYLISQMGPPVPPVPGVKL